MFTRPIGTERVGLPSHARDSRLRLNPQYSTIKLNKKRKEEGEGERKKGRKEEKKEKKNVDV